MPAKVKPGRPRLPAGARRAGNRVQTFLTYDELLALRAAKLNAERRSGTTISLGEFVRSRLVKALMAELEA